MICLYGVVGNHRSRNLIHHPSGREPTTHQDSAPTRKTGHSRHRRSPISDPLNRQRQPDIAGPADRVSVEERLSV